MSTLAKTEQNGNGQLVKTDVFDDFQLLDVYSETGIAPKTEQPRMNYIATVSAGQKVEKTRKDGSTYTVPQATKDGTIYVSGEAPALEEALKANGNKSLTIMFPSNNPKDFIHQSFQEHSATSLLAYGDGESITVIKNGDRTTFAAGTKEYDEVRSRCKVVVFVYFTLAEWTDAGADMVFNDGVGLYRMKFTSRNSLDSLLFAVRYVYRMTDGYIAGIPFDAFLREEQHSDKTGSKRDCWIWQFRLRPKNGVRLDAMRFRQLAEHGTHQINLLQLNAPEPETVDDAIAEAESSEFIDAIEGDVVSSESTPNPEPKPQPTKAAPAPVMCDVRDYQKKYFAIAGKTSFASDKGRAAFVAGWTGGKMDSLTTLLSSLTTAMADEFIAELERVVEIALADAKAATPPAAKPATPPAAAPDPLRRHKKKIMDQAKELWGEADWKEKLALDLGHKGWGNLTAKELDSVVVRLAKAIREKNEPPVAATSAPDLELTPDPEPSGHEPAETPLSKQIHANRVAAANNDFDGEYNPFDDDDDMNVNADGEVIE